MKTLLLCSLIFLCNNAFGQSYVKNSYLTSDNNFQKERKWEDWLNVDSISIYGGGTILSLLTSQDSSKNAVSPSGSIGLNFRTPRISCNFYFSFNATRTIEIKSLEQFGSALMNPNSSGQSLNLEVTAQLFKRWGLYANLFVVDNNWQIDSSTLVESSPFVMKLGVYFSPFNFELIRENNVKFLVRISYTHREIMGDFNQKERTIENINIVPRGYNGVDLSFNLVLNMVEMYVQFSRNDVLEKKSQTHIPGFSGSQVAFGLNVSGDLLKLK